jgi:hypothetical protein
MLKCRHSSLYSHFLLTLTLISPELDCQRETGPSKGPKPLWQPAIAASRPVTHTGPCSTASTLAPAALTSHPASASEAARPCERASPRGRKRRAQPPLAASHALRKRPDPKATEPPPHHSFRLPSLSPPQLVRSHHSPLPTRLAKAAEPSTDSYPPSSPPPLLRPPASSRELPSRGFQSAWPLAPRRLPGPPLLGATSASRPDGGIAGFSFPRRSHLWPAGSDEMLGWPRAPSS